MKTLTNIIAFAALTMACGAFTACTEDKVYEVDVNAIPLASDYADAVLIDVDQNTNTATFSFNATGVYPVWIIDGKQYSTSHSMSRFYRKAGEYQVEVKVGNANGISQGAITKTFTVDKTQMNGFGGFVYESPFNLWTSATKQVNSFYYAPGWSQIADPVYNFDGDAYTLTLPEATTDQWQAQMHIGTDISLPQGELYDGSFIFTASKDMNNVTLKIHPDGDDDDAHSFFCNRKINLTAGEPETFWFHELPAVVPMNNLVFTLDFGGNPAGVEVIIENFVLKKSSDDDGTVLPEVPTTPEPVWVGVDSPDNLWSTAATNTTFYYAPGWNQIADPVVDFTGKDFTVSLPEATFERWQCQVALHTDIKIDDPNMAYDFKVELESNTDLAGATIKLVQADEPDKKHDGNFFFDERVDLAAGTRVKFWTASVKAPEAMHAVDLVLDFGGNAAGTEIKVSNITLQVHHD